MLDQVFFFVTPKCNINCITCYANGTLSGKSELKHKDKIELLKYFRKIGAKKLTLLGGEPTQYPLLGEIIYNAKKEGYNFLRINTNGLFDKKLLLDENFSKLDVICFSIDSHIPQMNDFIRKNGNLVKTIENLKHAKKYNYEIRINSTITSLNIDHTEEIIKLAENEGAEVIYFNVVMMMGNANKNKELSVNPAKWLKIYDRIIETKLNYKIRIKIPPSFSNEGNLKLHQDNGHKCIASENKRVYITTNGDIYNSIVFIDNEKYRIGHYHNKEVFINQEKIKSTQSYCEFLSCNNTAYYPLCIYYKTKLNY
jgi:MoaA/NifB/PqqE/SkfB family radical SAM enzyme